MPRAQTFWNTPSFYPPGHTLLTLPNHYHYSQIGLPLTIQQSLLAEFASPIHTTPGNVGGPQNTVYLPEYRSVELISPPPELFQQVSTILDSTVSTIIESILGFKTKQCSPWGFFSYAPGGQYKIHMDVGYIDHDSKLVLDYPCRVISAVYFLNESPRDFTGGEFELMPVSHESIIFQPKADHLLLFPSDVRYPHRVHPVISGTRYSIVSWFSVYTDN